MVKPYFNNAIIGNSRVLACLTETGELVRLFWPNIDHQQHIDNMYSGVFFTGQKNSTTWLHEKSWKHRQSYIEDTNILRTFLGNEHINLKILQTDFVLIEKDVIIRQYEIENTGINEIELGFVLYSSAVTTIPDLRSTLFDFDCDALIHYKHGSYISIFSDQTVCQFQLGNNAYESAKYGVLGGYDSIGMMPDGALLWELGSFKSRERKRIVLYICIASSLKEVKALTRSVKKYDIECHYYRTKKYWNSFLKNTRQISTGNSNVDRLYKRSLLVFKLMSDKETGGLLASPEIDENFTKSGRYAYCWGRDAAFITSALDKCGLKDLVYNFYCWAAKTQEDDGSWAQRYYIDGNLAPSWGMQIDETGTLIWGMFQHFLETGDKAFLKSMWYNIEKGVEFLVDFIDKDMGLPKPSYDLWEERFGVHTYSCVAVYAGIRSGADIAEILEISGGMAEKWGNAAERLRDTIVKEMWREDIGSFLRSKLTKLNPWGSEPGNNKIVIQVNPKGYQRDVTLVDERVDVSLLGVAVPFGVFDINDPRVESTVKMIESKLTVYSVGGMMRYEGDNYIGGNPWIVATLWIALYYVRKRDFERANHYLEWAVKGCTELELLPEQVDKESGEAAWVIPLTWSHAMFVLVLIELVEAGEM